MVRGRFTQCPLGLQGTRWSDVHDGRRSRIELLAKSEAKHAKLDRDGAGGSRHVHAGDAVVVVFHAKSRVQRGDHRAVSR